MTHKLTICTEIGTLNMKTNVYQLTSWLIRSLQSLRILRNLRIHRSRRDPSLRNRDHVLRVHSTDASAAG